MNTTRIQKEKVEQLQPAFQIREEDAIASKLQNGVSSQEKINLIKEKKLTQSTE